MTSKTSTPATAMSEPVKSSREDLHQSMDYLLDHFPGLTPENLWSRLREAVPLNPPPAWAEALDEVLIDWPQLLFSDRERFHEVFNQRDRYTFQSQFAELKGDILAGQLASGSPFMVQTRLIASVLTAAIQAEYYLLRLDPAWFVWYQSHIDVEWAKLEWQSPRDCLLKRYDLGWMHPALRQREVPPDFSWTAGVTHAYAYLILHTLTRLPPATHQESLLNQIDRFRVYNPRLEPDLRDWLRRFLRLPPDSSATPMDCWKELEQIISTWENRQTVVATGYDLGGDSVYGRNKQGNRNEDNFLSLTESGVALLVLADGVSTAQIGTGKFASITIEEVLNREEKALREKLQKLAHQESQEASGWTLIEDFFAQCHRAVVDKINAYLADPQQPLEGHTMSSTLVVALVLGNRVLIGHWGDSRAYRISTRSAIRLTEDHNKEQEALQQGKTRYTRPEAGQGAPLIRVLGQCRYDDTSRCYQPVEQKISRDRAVLAPDEWLLLCSDGLLSGFSVDGEAEKEAKLVGITRQFATASCRELARQLVRAADDDRGDDNTTAVLLRLQPTANDPKNNKPE